MKANLELWRWVKGYEFLYEVSTFGRVRTLKSKHKGRFVILKHRPGHFGYPKQVLYKDQIRKEYAVHRLVAEAFLPNPELKAFVNHIDSNPTNCHVSNLEWVTPSENILHALRMGRLKPLRGISNPNNKLTENDVIAIREALKSRKRGTIKALADLYGVKPCTIRSIEVGRLWKHLGLTLLAS